MFIKKITPNWIIWLTIISVTWVNFNQERWLRKDVFDHDVGKYYSYLPALFSKHDLKLSFVGDSLNLSTEGRLYSPRFTPEGKPVIKMSMGMAISYLPFFTIAHIVVRCTNKTKDAFSEPYQFAILFSTLFYYVLGLFFLGKILMRFFNQGVVSLTLLCVTFGTNVFYYLTFGAGMSHIVSFTGVAIFIYYTVQWHEEQKAVYALLLGLVCGYLTLVRPINILISIFFLFYEVKNFADIKKKYFLYKQHIFHLILIVITGFLVFLPQMLYWKYVTGHFLFNSYVGEHFYFNNPHILKGIFGFRKGWLVYTPIMALSIAGVVVIYKKMKGFFCPIVLFLLLYIYVAFSWWCWWYGGSFGQRALIDIYPLLALPFAALLTGIQNTKPLIRKFIYSLISLLILLNLFQTVQAKYNVLHYDSMTFESYRQIFFTIKEKPDREKYLQHPDYEKAQKGLEE